MIGFTEGRKKIAAKFRHAEESKETVANGDVFEAKALGWYLKTEVNRRTPRDTQKATAVNKRRSATSPMPRILRWVIKGRRLRDSLNEGCVFRLNWIKIRSLGSAV